MSTSLSFFNTILAVLSIPYTCAYVRKREGKYKKIRLCYGDRIQDKSFHLLRINNQLIVHGKISTPVILSKNNIILTSNSLTLAKNYRLP